MAKLFLQVQKPAQHLEIPPRPMTKGRLIERITNLGYNVKESSELLEGVISIVKDTLQAGETVKLAGFGSFIVKQKNPRRGRNPQTGETITLNGRRVVTFKTSSILREAINKEQ